MGAGLSAGTDNLRNPCNLRMDPELFEIL